MSHSSDMGRPSNRPAPKPRSARRAPQLAPSNPLDRLARLESLADLLAAQDEARSLLTAAISSARAGAFDDVCDRLYAMIEALAVSEAEARRVVSDAIGHRDTSTVISTLGAALALARIDAGLPPLPPRPAR